MFISLFEYGGKPIGLANIDECIVNSNLVAAVRREGSRVVVAIGEDQVGIQYETEQLATMFVELFF